MSQSKEFIRSIENHSALVSKVVFVYADNVEDRNDLKQEIISQAWKSFSSFRGDSKFSTWLYRVAMNVAISFVKQNQKRREMTVPSATESYQISSGTDLLDTILHVLNSIEKSIVLLQIEGYAQTEIAQIVGVSEVNIRTKIHRIRKKLKKHGIDQLT